MIEIKQLNKWYNQFHVLKNISLSIASCERIVICGPSGSGKSTLIRCINRLEDYQEGSISIHGEVLTQDPNQIKNIRRRIGMVFQQFNLFPHLTILKNLTLGPIWVNKIDKKHAKETALYYLSRVGIEEQAHKYPGKLSGGQQQRAAIARALCMNCDVLLFDEPTSSLDPEMIQEVLDTMITLANDRNITMICVTHEMGFARHIADRIIFMDKGEIVEISQPELFFTNPSHPRTRDFLEKVLHNNYA